MLLGYTGPSPAVDSRIQQTALTIRQNDVPNEYLDATAAHLCPLDYLSHSLLPTILRRGRITTITIDPSPGYMNPIYWDHIPAVVNGITAFITSKKNCATCSRGARATCGKWPRPSPAMGVRSW